MAQSAQMNAFLSISASTDKRNLRDQVDALLPDWQNWYPSLFDAAHDLGLLRARVCDLSTLVLSKRHANVYSEALQAFREKWSVEDSESTAASPNSSDTANSSSEDSF